MIAFAAAPTELVDSPTFHFARAAAYIIANVYAVKMAAVFMISTSTVAISTQFAPRWIAVVGYLLALILLLGGSAMAWSIVVLPAWVLLVSIHILLDNFRRPDPAAPMPG